MKKIFLILIFLFSSNIHAQHFGNANRYDVTIKKIQVCETAVISSETSFTTSNCVTLGNSDLTVDIASTSVGSTLGKYADTTAMIQGRTYRYFVPTLSRSFTIKGSVDFTKASDSSAGKCNTDEDASIASNARHVTLSAGKVGGIYANSNQPFDFIFENLKIQTNLIQLSFEYKVKTFLFLGSSCI